MVDREHARLSASASHRWLNCPGSLLLEEQYPEQTSEYAEEGELAHEVAEAKASRYYIKGYGDVTLKKAMAELKKNKFWNKDMDGYTDAYLNYLKTLSNGMEGKPYVAIEKRVNYDKYAKGGFGTADCIMIQGDTIHICDFKYGKGVRVEAEENTQLMLYALGAHSEYGFIYPIKKTVPHIIQPRLNNCSSWVTSIEDLLKFGKYVKKQSDLALSGEGEFVPGEHCRFCKAKATCKARAEENIKLAGFTKTNPKELTNEEVGKYLAMGEDIEAWVKDLKAYALTECLAGREVDGWKAVEGRSVRKITDEEGLAKKLMGVGFEEVMLYKPKQLETLTKLEKLVGKKEFADLGKDFIGKPAGKPTLVKMSDKRDTITNVKSAKEAFKDGKGK